MKPFRYCLILIICLSLLLSSCQSSIPDGDLLVDILAIGKADCILLRTGDQVIMIDTGEKENTDEIFAFLDQNRIQTIDVLILSHFDKDHIGGAEALIKRYPVEKLIQSSFSSDRPEFPAYHNALSDLGKSPVVLYEDFSFSLGSYTVSISVPKKESYLRKEDNNASLIVTVENSNHRLLFCGDAMEERLEEFMAENKKRYSFVKLPCHGNDLDCYDAFLSQLTCPYGVITDSNKNPADSKALNKMKKHGLQVFETRYGTVSVRVSDEIYVAQTK
jgi:beta-lactamase superfamily II metal-dependent hydrolase